MPHTSSQSRILHLAFPRLAIDRIARQKWGKSWRLGRRPESPPIAVVAPCRNAVRIVAHEAGMERLGIHVDMPLGDAPRAGTGIGKHC